MREEAPRQTKGEVESAIANAIVRFHREQHGRGPEDARAYIVGNMILARCLGILTPTEAKLAGSEEGRRLVRSARHELRTISHAEVEGAVAAVTGCTVLRSYSDVDVNAAELVEVFILDRDLEILFEAKLTRPLHHR